MASSVLNPSDVKVYVDEIVRILQANLQSSCGLRVSEVVKGGSLGQGTAVPGEFDLDLIIYSTDIGPQDMLDQRRLNRYLQNIDRVLSHYGSGHYRKTDMTDHAIRADFSGIEVDILPSPYWHSPADFHAFMARLSSHQHRMLSCSAAKWQKEFFGRQPNEVKEYIKRAKAWRNKMWPKKNKSDGRPKSFLIGLLVVKAYERSRTGGAQLVTDLMKNDVRGHNQLSIHWTGGGAFYSSDYSRRFPMPPYIIDPANPFNNVYLSGIGKYEANSPEGTYEPGDGNWTQFVCYVDTLDLRKIDGTR